MGGRNIEQYDMWKRTGVYLINYVTMTQLKNLYKVIFFGVNIYIYIYIHISDAVEILYFCFFEYMFDFIF